MTEQRKKTRFIKGRNYVTRNTFCISEATELNIALKIIKFLVSNNHCGT
jgi:hypothetical protein